MKFIHEPNRIYSTDENGKVIAEITFPRTEPGIYTIINTGDDDLVMLTIVVAK